MPSRKILVILIICLGMVGAVWILSPSTTSVSSISANSDIAVASSSSETGGPINTDWQNILGSVESTTTIASDLLGVANADDTTLTSQLAKDFFGRYLVTQGQQIQNGVDLTNGLDTDTSTQIASDVLSSGSYTTNQAVKYTAKNLNIQPNSDKTTTLNYLSFLKKYSVQMSASNKQNGNEVDIINKAILNQDKNEITKLDPIIQSYKTFLSGLIKAPVPGDATSLHLEFVNSISVFLSDLEAIRATFTDPVKSLSALSSYKQDYTDVGSVIQKWAIYVQIKTKSFK